MKQGLFLINLSKVNCGVSEEVVLYDPRNNSQKVEPAVVCTTCKTITRNLYVKASEDIQKDHCLSMSGVSAMDFNINCVSENFCLDIWFE